MVPHALTRTITESDNINFSAATLNPAPLHLDSSYAAETEFGRPLVNSMFTLALLVGISVHETTHGTTIANLGFESVTFPAPLFPGDSVHAETEVVGSRPSGSRPRQRDSSPLSTGPSTRRTSWSARPPAPPSCTAGHPEVF